MPYTEKDRRYHKKYREENSARIKEYKQNWYLRNKEHAKTKAKKWYKENRDRARETRRVYELNKLHTNIHNWEV